MAWSTSPQSDPPPTRTVFFFGSTRTYRIGDRSITRPSSHTPRPPALWPPPRMDTSSLLLAGEVHGGDDVGDVGASRDEAGPAVDHRVVDLASLVVLRVAGLDELPAQAALERGNGGVSQHVSSTCSTARLCRGRRGRPSRESPPIPAGNDVARPHRRVLGLVDGFVDTLVERAAGHRLERVAILSGVGRGDVSVERLLIRARSRRR